MEVQQYIDFNYIQKSKEYIAQGCLTNSKSPKCHIEGTYPTHVEKGRDSYLYTRSGHSFVDYICGLGTCLLGYANPDVNNAAINEIHNGMCFSIASTLECDIADIIAHTIPYIESMKFLKTSSEACTASLKIARAYTNRYFVLSEGYHGWHPEFTTLTPPASGCPDSAYIRSFESIEQINDSIAAVIIEPIQLDYSPERISFLQDLRNKCNETGTILIFDETITGFRWRNWTVGQYYNIYPDLTILGKAIANGYPLSLVGGNKDIMNNSDYFVSSTYAGENTSLAACGKVIELIHNKVFDIDDLWNYGQQFIDKVNSLFPGMFSLKGYPTRARFEKGNKDFSEDALNKFYEMSCESGILFGPSWFYNFCHIEIQNIIFGVLDSIASYMHNTQDFSIKGSKPCPPYSNKSRS